MLKMVFVSLQLHLSCCEQTGDQHDYVSVQIERRHFDPEDTF